MLIYSLSPWRCPYSFSATILQQRTFSKVHFTLVWAAHARAKSVFPVPGGPYIRTPFGGWIPKFSNFSLWFIGRTMASTSCSKRKVLRHKTKRHKSRLPVLRSSKTAVLGHTGITSWICLSSPPMSLYCSVGLSSTSMAFTRESYSVGRVSRIKYESLFTPCKHKLSAFNRPFR